MLKLLHHKLKAVEFDGYYAYLTKLGYVTVVHKESGNGYSFPLDMAYEALRNQAEHVR